MSDKFDTSGLQLTFIDVDTCDRSSWNSIEIWYEVSAASKWKNVETYFLQAVGPSYPIPPPKHAPISRSFGNSSAVLTLTIELY